MLYEVITVDITFSLLGASSVEPRLVVNESVARQYHHCLCQLIKEYQLAPEVSLKDMLTQRDVISLEEPRPDMDTEWNLICEALETALAACNTMREQEGDVV